MFPSGLFFQCFSALLGQCATTIKTTHSSCADHTYSWFKSECNNRYIFWCTNQIQKQMPLCKCRCHCAIPLIHNWTHTSERREVCFLSSSHISNISDPAIVVFISSIRVALHRVLSSTRISTVVI